LSAANFDQRQLKMLSDLRIDPAVFDEPAMKRMMLNIERGGGQAATEVYRLDGKTPTEHLYFDVYSMREWSEKNAEKVLSSICWDRVKWLVNNGAIDVDRLMRHTIHEKMEPIIIGAEAAGPKNDQILDGAHRMVAYALAAAKAGLEGIPLPLLAYLLKPHEWKKFVIPTRVAQALNFDASY
jgi:hypothetical protein